MAAIYTGDGISDGCQKSVVFDADVVDLCQRLLLFK